MGEPFECLVSTYPCAIPDVAENRPCVEKLPDIGRRAIHPGTVPVNLVPEGVSPSALHNDNAAKVDNVPTFRYGDGLTLELSVAGAERGTLLHRCFELVSGNAMDAGILSTITGYQFCDSEVNVITKAAASFENWLTDRLKPLHVAREIPFLALNNSGSVINGSMDLLVETASGFWVIDHKSDQSDDIELRFARYAPQLMCYAEALGAARKDKPLLGVGVNWISRGAVSLLEADIRDSLVQALE